MDSLSSYVALTSTTYPTSLLFPSLPYILSILPSIFRIMAFLFFLPVILLAGSDVIGWTVFKLVLRPLGYASTEAWRKLTRYFGSYRHSVRYLVTLYTLHTSRIRFKDPEPSTLLVPVPSSSSSTSTSSSPKKNRPLSIISPDLSISSTFTEEPLLLSPTLPTSPIFSDSEGSQSSSNSSSQTRTNSTSTITTKNSSSSKRPKNGRSHSSSSSISSMNRFAHRSSSIGFEGPLIDCSSTPSHPGSSEDEEEVEEISDSESGEGEEGGGRVEILRRRKGRRGGEGIPRGGVAFGFTKVGSS